MSTRAGAVRLLALRLALPLHYSTSTDSVPLCVVVRVPQAFNDQSMCYVARTVKIYLLLRFVRIILPQAAAGIALSRSVET